MNSLLIHGCYDLKTLETLKEYDIKKLSFDLRARSLNLVTFRDFSKILSKLTTEQLFVTFENDKKETVHSYLSLLRNEPFTFTLIFRDSQPVNFYKEINYSFYWMFNPEGDWKSILKLPNAKGVLLPLKWQSLYQNLPELWELIEEESLDVFLHAENFEQTLFLNLGREIKVSVDLTGEIESGYRTVDQEKLKKMKIWRRFNENTARQ
jgi:hypothetical protein